MILANNICSDATRGTKGSTVCLSDIENLISKDQHRISFISEFSPTLCKVDAIEFHPAILVNTARLTSIGCSTQASFHTRVSSLAADEVARIVKPVASPTVRPVRFSFFFCSNFSRSVLYGANVRATPLSSRPELQGACAREETDVTLS